MIKPPWIIVTAVLGVFAGCSGPSTVSVSPSAKLADRMRVAVLDFDWEPPTGGHAPAHTVIHARNAGKFVADNVSAHLLEVPGFDVVERSKVAQLLAEKKLSQADLVRQGRFQEIGRFLGADLLVVGMVNSYTTWAYGFATGHVVSFSCRCVNVETSEVVWTLGGNVDQTGPIDPAISVKNILNDAIPKLKAKLQRIREKK